MTNPYAPPRADESAPRPAQPAGHCQVCGAGLALAQRLFDEQGEVICQSCLSARQVDEGHQKVAKKVKLVAYGSLVCGIFSWGFNPLFIQSLIAIGNGLYVLRSLRDGETSRRLGGATVPFRLIAGLGIAAGGLSLALRLLLWL